MTTEPIPLELRPVVNGRTWRLFSFDYSTADGEFSAYFYALSPEHAAMVLAELKETARNPSSIEGWEKR
jgi:hypothetical protein